MNSPKDKAEKILATIDPRLIASDPWRSIKDSLESLVDKVVLEMNPNILDDEIADTLDEWDNRENAIEYLIDKLQKQLKGE